MKDIINWCNTNNGFLTAILSVIGLFISVTAIVVSIHTARLPFKKKLKLSVAINAYAIKNMQTMVNEGKFAMVAINVTNCGSRTINLTYLGLGCYFDGQLNYFYNLNGKAAGVGLINPSEIHTTTYEMSDIISLLTNIKENTKLYVIAKDSEDKVYKKKYGTVKNIKNNLTKYVPKND